MGELTTFGGGSRPGKGAKHKRTEDAGQAKSRVTRLPPPSTTSKTMTTAQRRLHKLGNQLRKRTLLLRHHLSKQQPGLLDRQISLKEACGGVCQGGRFTLKTGIPMYDKGVV